MEVFITARYVWIKAFICLLFLHNKSFITFTLFPLKKHYLFLLVLLRCFTFFFIIHLYKKTQKTSNCVPLMKLWAEHFHTQHLGVLKSDVRPRRLDAHWLMTCNSQILSQCPYPGESSFPALTVTIIHKTNFMLDLKGTQHRKSW